MIAKHTEGPWMVKFETDRSCYIGSKYDSQLYFIGYGTGLPKGEHVANAHLISAAPELLEALEMLMTFEPSDCDSYERYIWDAALSAIVKAKGEKP